MSVNPFQPLPPLPHLDRNIAEAPTLSIFLTATHNTHPLAPAHPPAQLAVLVVVVVAPHHEEAHTVLQTIHDGGESESKRLRSNKVTSGLSVAVCVPPDHAVPVV